MDDQMILEIDAGNTRIKWRLIGHDGVGGSLHCICPDPGGSGAQGSTKELGELPTRGVTRVRVSNVRGASFKDELSAFFCEKVGVAPEFAASCSKIGGVTNGYVDPSRLGVDRWLALLAAYDSCRSACVVLDCGTTITLDIIDAGGMHKGGYIVPGVVLMRDSLSARTAALSGVLPDHISLEPGRNTVEAISNGLAAMVAGLAHEVHRRQSDVAGGAVWFVCGGDAALIQSVLPWSSQHVPALVLDGLRIALP